MTDDLKPCPFCGGTETTILNGPVEDDWCAVSCDKCYAQGPHNYTDPHAIAAWNRRALPAADTSALGAAVKPLVWEHHPMGLIAAPPTGRAYIIDIRVKNRVFFIKGMEPPPKVDTLDQAKSIAQADYTSRILAAIQPPTHAAQLAAALALPEVAAMVGSAKDVMDWRYGPTIRPDSTCFERMRSDLAALEARHDHN